MSKTLDTIAVRITCETPRRTIATAKLKALACAVCRKFHIRQAAISITIVGDKTIQALHKKFFRCAKTTDVISFDLSEPLEKQRCFDIIINADQAGRQARLRGLAIQAEMSLYLVHGLLHQLGFDDLTTAKARRMHQQEDEILQDAGFGNVYYSGGKD